MENRFFTHKRIAEFIDEVLVKKNLRLTRVRHLRFANKPPGFHIEILIDKIVLTEAFIVIVEPLEIDDQGSF